LIFTLFWALFIISIVLIGIGVIFIKEWSGVAIIGFTFLFLLSFIILQGNLEIQTGSNITSSYNYSLDGSVDSTFQSNIYVYDYWDDSNSHIIGYFLAIISGIGTFSSILITLGKWGGK